MIVISIASVIVAVAGGILWAAWRWARRYEVIARSDHYERRNF
ncbi:hypothetical protein ACT89R_01640 [Rhodococcus qingshengii]